MAANLTKESEWLESIHQSISSLVNGNVQSCSIYLVPGGLKKCNLDAYMPRVVSIGPRFIGREDLVPMEERKFWMDAVAVRTLVLDVRLSYAPNMVELEKLSDHELAKIILVDGCFLLELLISKGLDSKFPSMIPGPSAELINKEDVLSDLMLFENQIPIFVIYVLFQTLFPSWKERQRRPKLKRCALRLLTAGVTILPEDKDSTGFGALSWLSGIFVVNSGKHMDNIPEAEGLDFYFDFYNNKLEIKQLHITKTTKAKWCNLIAMEHHQKIQCIQTTYRPGSIYSSNSIWAALIFNDLICSADDVQFLRDKKIIVDHINMSNQELMEFFRKIPLGFDYRAVVDSNNYTQMVDNINNFSKSFVIKRIWSTVWNSFTYRQEWLLRFLNRNYNFVATVISLCTVVQTIYAIIAYQFPKKYFFFSFEFLCHFLCFQ
ncbi:hypothetical protein QL285_086211 [Trifolium repens]|nr:hypothetical protein QL285_086211 [Trifolium repens]